MKNDCVTDLREKVIRLEERLVSSDKALLLAHQAIKDTALIMDKRLEGMNEFRSTLKDQAGTFITRQEYDQSVAFQNKILGAIAVLVFIIPFIVSMIKNFK